MTAPAQPDVAILRGTYSGGAGPSQDNVADSSLARGGADGAVRVSSHGGRRCGGFALSNGSCSTQGATQRIAASPDDKGCKSSRLVCYRPGRSDLSRFTRYEIAA